MKPQICVPLCALVFLATMTAAARADGPAAGANVPLELSSPGDPSRPDGATAASGATPTDASGASAQSAASPLKVTSSADTGGAVRTTTGASVALGASVSVTKGDPADGGLTYTGTVNGLLGSTAGPAILPEGEAGFSVSGRANQGLVGQAADYAARLLDPSGKQDLQKSWVAGIDVDRDLMVNRTFRANAEGSLVLTHGDPNHGNSWTLAPTVATGVGVIGAQALPYIVAGAKGKYTYCPYQSKGDSDELCLVADGTGLAGVFQAQAIAGGSVEWRHKIADESQSKWIHQLVIGAGGGGEVDANLAGVQAGAQSGLTISIH